MSNINEMNLADEPVEYDPSVEEVFTRVLPPDGIYTAALKLGKNGVEIKSKGGRNYVMASIQANIKAPGTKIDNSVVFDQATSIIFDSGTSTLHVLLKKIGLAAPPRCTLGQLKELVETGLAGQPVVRIKTRWETRVKGGDGKYQTLLKGMTNYPQNEKGEYIPETTLPDGETVMAKAAIREYL